MPELQRQASEGLQLGRHRVQRLGLLPQRLPRGERERGEAGIVPGDVGQQVGLVVALDGSQARRAPGLEPDDWKSLHAWFIGSPGRRADADNVRRLATDALRALHPREDKLYTFWDYTAGCWQRDAGFRIDHLLCSPQAADRLQGASVHKWARGEEKASDHAPVGIELA